MSDQTMLVLNHEDLIPDATNLRERVSLPELRELAVSIGNEGVLQPIRVYADDNGQAGKYHIISGHRRWAAVGILKDEGTDVGIPAVVVPFDSMDAVKVQQLIENIQRADLDPIDEAKGYAALQDNDRKVKDIVKLVGKSQAHVSKRLALLKLPKVVHQAIRMDLCGLDTAYQLSKFAQYQQEIEDLVTSYIEDKRQVDDNAVERLGQNLEKAERRMNLLKILEGRGVEVVDVGTIDTKTLERIEVIDADELPEAAFGEDDIVTLEMPSYGFPKITRWGVKVKGRTEKTDAELKERDAKRTEREAKAARLEQAQLLARRPAKGAVGELAVINMANNIYGDQAKTVLQILVIEPDITMGKKGNKDGDQVDVEIPDFIGTVVRIVKEAEVPLHRVALAVMLARFVHQGPPSATSRTHDPAFAAVADFIDNQSA